MDEKQYKHIDWSKQSSINNTYSGYTNKNMLAMTLNEDGEWVADPNFQKEIKE